MPSFVVDDLIGNMVLLNAYNNCELIMVYEYEYDNFLWNLL